MSMVQGGNSATPPPGPAACRAARQGAAARRARLRPRRARQRGSWRDRCRRIRKPWTSPFERQDEIRNPIVALCCRRPQHVAVRSGWGSPFHSLSVRSGSPASRLRPSPEGRKSQFALSGTSRWPAIAIRWLTCPSARMQPNGKFRGTAVSRPMNGPTSGIGIHGLLPANPGWLHRYVTVFQP